MAIVECGFPLGLTIPGQSPLSTKAALAQRGPTILVDIGFDPAFFGNTLRSAPGGVSTAPVVIPSVQVPALIDTGASESCIDEQLAQQLQLPLIDTTITSGIGGSVTLNMYLAHISIPELVTEYGQFTGVHLQGGGQFHRALIGRKLLDDVLLVYDGHTGLVRLAR
jgi:predicted aspartyl protease